MKLTVEKWIARYNAGEFVRVFFNGQDVTNRRCIFADDETGIVHQLRENDDGEVFRENGEIAMEILRGHVEFVVEARSVR